MSKSLNCENLAEQEEEEEAEEDDDKTVSGIKSTVTITHSTVSDQSNSENIVKVAHGLTPRDLERLQQLNSSTQTSISEYDSLADLLGSREQRIVPMMTSSWLENVNKYSELEGDSAIFASQDSLEVLNWSTQDCGRPGSPLRFDHEEILRIDEDEERDSGRGESVSPTRHFETDHGNGNWGQRLKFSDTDLGRIRNELEQEFETKLVCRRRGGNGCRCTEKREEHNEWRKQCNRLTEEKQRLTEQIQRLQKSHEDMKSVIAEYETTIQKLIDGKERKTAGSQSKEALSDLTCERDQAIEELRSVESAFSDLHRRYEKSKQAVDAYKKNEELLRKCVEDLQEKGRKQEEKFASLKEQAENKLAKANKEIETHKRRSESDLTILNAALKKAELEIGSLQQTIQRKVKENEELSAICDELISRVGPKNQN